MRNNEKYVTSSKSIIEDIIKTKNSVTWCSLMDTLKSRAKAGDDESLEMWLTELTRKSVERGHITSNTKYVIIDARNDKFNITNTVYNLDQIKDVFKMSALTSNTQLQYITTMLLSQFKIIQENDFNMQFEVIQDILLYNKIFDR